jgi:hypothetical protein
MVVIAFLYVALFVFYRIRDSRKNKKQALNQEKDFDKQIKNLFNE